MKYANMGFEFAAAVCGFSLLGYWIDRHWQIEGRWGLIVCAGLGVVGGLYNLIRQAVAAAAEASGKVSEPSGGEDDAKRL